MALSDFTTTLDDLRRRGKTSARVALATLDDLIARGRAIATAVQAVAAGSATRIAVPFADVLALVADLEAFTVTYLGDLDYPPDLFLAVRDAQSGLTSLQVLRRVFAAQQTGTGATDDAPVTPTGPLVPYILRQGDTLERLAASTLRDVTRWPEIAELNRLVYPFVDTDRDLQGPQYSYEFAGTDYMTRPSANRDGVGAGIVVPGDLLWLPSDAQVPAGSSFTPRDVELYGRDFALADGLLSITGHDAATVEGQDNIVQALRQRIGTVRGELVLHGDYGMDQALAVGIEGTRANTLLAGLDVARTVRQDPRVTRVRNLDVLFQDTTNHVQMQVGLIGPSDRDIPLNLILPGTISAGAP